MGHIQMPPGKKIAVSLGVDFDAQSLWLGAFNMPSPAMMARGEFGAVVGAPRLLDVMAKYGIKTTWFTPGHTIDTFPDMCKRVQAEGHEIAHHGYYHENPTKIKRETEKRLAELAFESFERHLNMRPVGYRSPYWDYSDSTLDLVEEFGFIYDSSLMARDLVPYRPRRWQVRWEQGCVQGRASKVLEIPVNWYLDDFPPLAYVTGIQAGQADTAVTLQRWKDIFDYGYQYVENACFAMAVHPQIIGQAHHMMMFERLIQHIDGHDGVWYATCEEIARAWVDDDEDKRQMELEDVRGVEPAPPDSGFHK